MKRYVIILILLILFTPASVSAGEGDNVKITEVYYRENPGSEYIVIENWGESVNIEDWILDDGEGWMELPDMTLKSGERLVISEDDKYKDVWREEPDLTWKDDLSKGGTFELATDGDGLLLKNEQGKVVDSFYYGDTTIGKGWEGEPCAKAGYGVFAKRKKKDTDRRDDWNWTRDWKVGISNFSAETFSFRGNCTVFSSPDSSLPALEDYLDGVENSLSIAVYQIESGRIARKLMNMSEDGVDIRVLVESGPVGGLTREESYCLSLLKKEGVEVALHGKDYSPYPYLHCKYMVADNRSVLVTSENLGNTGFPHDTSCGNRGWGAVLEDKDLANYYSSVFKEDWYFSEEYEQVDISNVTQEEMFSGYRPRYEKKSISGSFEVMPVLSPDTSMARDTILGMIDSAESSIYVQQFYAYNWGGRENPYIENLIQAAKRGVEVDVLLDSTWYNVQENVSDNDDTIERLNQLSFEKDISLEARLIDDEHGFAKVHNKGMIVDEKEVLISSINWNSNSVLQNRETGMVIRSKKVGSYFSKIFQNDWRSDVVSPIADAGRNRSIEVGEIVTFTGVCSWDDQQIREYRWDLDGDGRFEEEGENVSKVYSRPGQYRVRLLVKDYEGNTDSDLIFVDVEKSSDTHFFRKDEEGPPYLVALLLCIIILTPVGIYYLRCVRD